MGHLPVSTEHVHSKQTRTVNQFHHSLEASMGGRITTSSCRTNLYSLTSLVSVSRQLLTSAYYRPLEYGDILWKCLVVLRKCVVSERPLPITALYELRNRFVLTMDLICRTSASASDSRKVDFDWSYHSSKTAEKGSSSYAGTPMHSRLYYL